MISRLLRKLFISTAIIAMFCLLAAAAETATVTANGGLNFRVSASANSQKICTIPQGASVTVNEKGAEWSNISYNSRTGYVMTKFLKFPTYTNTAKVAVSAANIRAAASESSACIQTIPGGTQVTIVSWANNWYTVKYGNITGYIRGDLLTVNTTQTASSNTSSQKRTNLINYAASLLGTPYRSGGASASGFDCSGFTYYVFKKFGYDLPRGPASQMNALGTKIAKSDLKPGDLVFFKNPYSGRAIGHVGIYVGNGKMIHSNKPGGSVRYVTINSGYYATNYVGARRVIFD